MEKYILTDTTKEMRMESQVVILHRIQAVRDFDNVHKGELGGWLQNESNLSQEGDCWVANEACVYGNAKVYDSAQVYDNAKVYDSAKISDNAQIYGMAEVYGNAQVFAFAKVYDSAQVYGLARIFRWAEIYSNAKAYGAIMVFGKAMIGTNMVLDGRYDLINEYGAQNSITGKRKQLSPDGVQDAIHDK